MDKFDFIGLFIGYIIYLIFWLFEFFQKLNKVLDYINEQNKLTK